MIRKLLFLLLFMALSTPVFAAYKFNPNTGRLDYYESPSDAVSNEAYGSNWNGVTAIAPSKNAIYDKINSMSAANVNWAGIANYAPGKYLKAIAGEDVNWEDLELLQRAGINWASLIPGDLDAGMNWDKDQDTLATVTGRGATTTVAMTVGNVTIGSATGVLLSGLNGVLTLTGKKTAGNNEDLSFNFETTANQVAVSSSTGVSKFVLPFDLYILDELYHSTDTNTGLYFDGSDGIYFKTGGTSRVYIGNTGLYITQGYVQVGGNGTDGSFGLYSEQGATDYTAKLYANTAMTSDANFYFPADEPSATSYLTMTAGGVMGYVVQIPSAGINWQDITNITTSNQNWNEWNGAAKLGSGAVNWDSLLKGNVNWDKVGGDQSTINLSGFNNDSGFITGINWQEETGWYPANVWTATSSGANWQTAAPSGVTSVTGTAPITSSGGTTPAIGMNWTSVNDIGGKPIKAYDAINWNNIGLLQFGLAGPNSVTGKDKMVVYRNNSGFAETIDSIRATASASCNFTLFEVGQASGQINWDNISTIKSVVVGTQVYSPTSGVNWYDSGVLTATDNSIANLSRIGVNWTAGAPDFVQVDVRGSRATS